MIAAAPPTAVAIPANNEAAFIGACLAALCHPKARPPDHIVLLINNTTDATEAIARAVTRPQATALHIVSRDLPPHRANAGHARRLAMDIAADHAGECGVVLTTDADGVADQNWIDANLAALAAGAEAVAGWVSLDPVDHAAIPAALHAADAREYAYDTLCDALHHRLDPDLADPFPRHTQNSGASLAVRVAAYRGAGGVPDVVSGEDRALVAALRRIDAAVRHAPEVHVTVSGRTVGRAVGGMAETIARRLVSPETYLDDRLEPALICARRARLRAACRAAHNGEKPDWAKLTRLSGLSLIALRAALRSPNFGQAWENIEAQSPRLLRRRVPLIAVPREMLLARALLAAHGLDRALLRLGPKFTAPRALPPVKLAAAE